MVLTRVHTRRMLLIAALSLAAASSAAAVVKQDQRSALPSLVAARDARVAAEEPAIDVAGVIEKVRHHVAASGDALRAHDPQYRLELRRSGLSLALRRPNADDIEPTPSFAVATTSIRIGGAGAPVAGGSWVPSENRATRVVAPGVTERVTALDGAIEWDFIVASRPSHGAFTVTAAVSDGTWQTIRRPSPALRHSSPNGRTVRVGELVVKDAAGTELYRALPTARRGELTLTVPARVMARASYPVTIDPLIGPEQSPADPTYVVDDEYRSDAAVARSGSCFLVVWEDRRNESGNRGDIYGARVSPAGVVLDPSGIPLVIDGDVERPQVASNGNGFVVVYHRANSLDHRHVAEDGRVTKFTNPFPQAVGSHVEIASDGTGYLTTWGHSGGVWASRLNANGSFADPAATAVSTHVGYRPAVASNGSTYLITWGAESEYGDENVYAALVHPEGRVWPTNVLVTIDAGNQMFPTVASLGAGGAYAIVWEDWSPASGAGGSIRAARVSNAAAVLDIPALTVATGAGSSSRPRIAAANGGYFVAWNDSRTGSGTGIFGTQLTAGGGVVDPNGRQLVAPTSFPPVVSLTTNGSGFAIAWQRSHKPGSASIYLSRMTSSGALVDVDGIAVSTTAAIRNESDVASNGTNHLVIWMEGRGEGIGVYGARISATGQILDPRGIAICAGTWMMGLPDVESNGTDYLVAWMDARDDREVYAARVTGGGLVLDQQGFNVTRSPAFHQGDPAIGSDGNGYFIAWSDSRNVHTDVYGARVANDGTVLDPNHIAIANAPGLQGDPVVATNGPGSYLVAFGDRRNHPPQSIFWDVYAARVANGAVLDPAGIPVGTGEAYRSQVGVASDGSSFLVTWDHRQDSPDSVNDVRAARVSAQGTVLDSPPIGVAATGARESNNAVAYDGGNYLVGYSKTGAYPEPDGAHIARVSNSGRVWDHTVLLEEHAWAMAMTTRAAGRVAIVYERSTPDRPYGRGTQPFVKLYSYNDLFAGAYAISGASGSAAETTFGAGKEPGEGSHYGTSTGASSVWYRYIAPGHGIVTFNTDGSAFDTVLAAYRGTALGALTLLASDDDGGAGNQSRISFYALAGVEYRIAIDGFSAGSFGAAALAWSWAADETPPDTVIDSAPPVSAASRDATFTFHGVDASNQFTYLCSVDDGAARACSSPMTVTGLAEGSHRFEVRAIDAAGNRDATPATHTWTVDVTPPETFLTSRPSSPSNTSTATFTFAAGENPSTFECSLDGTAFAACVSPATYRVADGSHTFRARARDVAGNVDPSPAEHTWLVDTVAPDTTIDSGPSGVTNSTTATFTFSSEAGATFTCSLDFAPHTACTSPKTYTNLVSGGHTFQVVAVDAAGNRDATPAVQSWSIDRTPPDTTITSGPSGPTPSTSATFAFSSSEAASTFTCSLDGGAFAPCTSPATYTALPDGPHTFAVRATDQAGNVDPSPATRSWYVGANDQSAPEARLVSPTPGYWRGGSQVFAGGPFTLVTGPVSVVFFADDAQSGVAGASFTVNGAAVPQSSIVFDPAAKTYRFTFRSDGAGRHHIVFAATNGVGIVTEQTLDIITFS